MARPVDIHEPNQVTWALGEERLRVLLPLATAERTTFVEIDAAARQLGITRARAMPQTLAGYQGDLKDLTAVVDDLIWAFTRNDAVYGDRFVYEAFASPGLDNPWHIARRRCAGPAAFRNLVLEVRHRMLATAVVLAGPRSLRKKLFGPARTWEGDIAALRHRLAPNDRTELTERQKHWASLSRQDEVASLPFKEPSTGFRREYTF